MSDAAPPTRQRPALAEREEVLAALAEVITSAWASFDGPRPEEPPVDARLAARLAEPMPEEPGPVGAALDDAARALDASVSPSRPLYLAYIGSTGLEVGVLGEALAATYDVNLATTAGGAELVERQALEWTAQFVGFPLAEGAFTSGGMTSNLTALLAARERALPGAREHGVGGRPVAVYASDEAHHSVVRAVEATGLGRACVRRIGLDGARRLRVDELRAALARDAAAGVAPVAVVANGGTTLTGAVDPLDAIADACAEHDVWLHVDGAYGLPAAGTATRGGLFRGLDRAHSATLDAHKWLGVQKGCSLVLVREAGALEAAFGHEERYMLHDAEHHTNPVDLTLEYSRPFRSLKLWLAFRVHGAAALRTGIEHTVGLAQRFAGLVAADKDFELLHEPTLSTVNFAHRRADNRALADAVRRDGRVYLAPAEVDGRTSLRVCFVNFRTTADEVDYALDVVRSLA